jgi:hypothetical protein
MPKFNPGWWPRQAQCLASDLAIDSPTYNPGRLKLVPKARA